VFLNLEVVVLLSSSAADVWRLAALDVNVLVQNLGGGVGDGHGLSNGDLLVDVLAGLLVDGLELLLGDDAPVEHLLLESGNGVVCRTHALDLLTGSVGGTGVGHGVASVSVCDVLENKRTVVVGGPLLSVLDGGLDGKDIHTVDLETRNVLTTLVVVGQGGRTVSSGTHTVLVVCRFVLASLLLDSNLSKAWLLGGKLTLATEKGRQLPELGHVESLKDLTLVAGTVTVQNDTSLLAASVLVCESQTGTDGDLGTDDTVSTVEALAEHVHGTTLSVGDTLAATEQLTNDGADGGTTHQGVTVASVGGNDIVLLVQGVLDTGCDGLLTSRQVAETSDLLLLV
jgi:hypothetical protein